MEIINLGPSFFTNCYIENGRDTCFVVDPGSKYELIEEKITKPVEFVLLTHGHMDHIDMIGKFDCPIYISNNDYKKLNDLDESLYTSFSSKRPSYDFNKLNIKIINDGDKIPFNNDYIYVISTPGHTNGSVCYKYKDKLYSGDTLFKQSIGRTDLPTGNEASMKESLIRLIDSLDDSTRVYPGHGDKTTIHDERLYNEYYKYFKGRKR